MVRLGGHDPQYCAQKKKFQFQYGAIGSPSIRSIIAVLILVSIPVWCDWEIIPFDVAIRFNPGFNSSMVRLGV